MAFTSAVPTNAKLNEADGSVTVFLVYSGPGETAFEDKLTLPAGSVLDEVTLRKEAIRRVSNRNSGRQFETFVKQIVDQPLDLTEPATPEDDQALREFAILRARELDLRASSADEGASTELYDAARAARKAAYESAKSDALRARMDSVMRSPF